MIRCVGSGCRCFSSCLGLAYAFSLCSAAFFGRGAVGVLLGWDLEVHLGGSYFEGLQEVHIAILF